MAKPTYTCELCQEKQATKRARNYRFDCWDYICDECETINMDTEVIR